MRRAVVDVGSGSVVLLVSELQDGTWVQVGGGSWMPFLGTGTRQTGILAEGPMAATLAAIREARGAADSLGADEFRAAGTMALRIARNAGEFLARAEADGNPIVVLSGEREAELGFKAVVNDPTFASHKTITIVDPGGQSTEITTATKLEAEEGGWHVRFSRSFPIGTLQLRGGPLATETPDPGEILSASALIDDTIGINVAPADVGAVVTLGAPGTDLVSMRLVITEWRPDLLHGAWLDYEDVGRAVGRLMRMTDAERAAVPGVEPARGGTIHAGCLVLERILNSLAASGCYVSIRGWRHAWLEESE
ncbi:hypothetical protein EON81_19110 [bacterium]|nr:MAG: hypothetical protein EON81_19110 [bacterium]